MRGKGKSGGDDDDDDGGTEVGVAYSTQAVDQSKRGFRGGVRAKSREKSYALNQMEHTLEDNKGESEGKVPKRWRK